MLFAPVNWQSLPFPQVNNSKLIPDHRSMHEPREPRLRDLGENHRRKQRVCQEQRTGPVRPSCFRAGGYRQSEGRHGCEARPKLARGVGGSVRTLGRLERKGVALVSGRRNRSDAKARPRGRLNACRTSWLPFAHREREVHQGNERATRFACKRSQGERVGNIAFGFKAIRRSGEHHGGRPGRGKQAYRNSPSAPRGRRPCAETAAALGHRTFRTRRGTPCRDWSRSPESSSNLRQHVTLFNDWCGGLRCSGALAPRFDRLGLDDGGAARLELVRRA